MIQEYRNHLRIGVLHKKRSPLNILLYTNDLPDMWLIDRVKYKKRTGEICEDVFILRKDFMTQLQYLRDMGYEGMIRTTFIVSRKRVSLKRA